MQYPPSGQNWPQQELYGYGQPSQPLPLNTQWGQQPYPPQQWQQPPSQPLPPNTQWGQQANYTAQQPWQMQPQYNYQYSRSYQPPLKKKRLKFFVLLAILIVIAGSLIAAFMMVSNQPALPSASSTALGQQIQVDGWVVTINKVTTSNGDSANVPQSGDIYLAIDVKLQNISSDVLIASSTVQFNLTDSTGQTYNQATTFEGSPNGELLEGGSLHGTLYYEVPSNIHEYNLRFVPSLFSGSDLAVWSITLS